MPSRTFSEKEMSSLLYHSRYRFSRGSTSRAVIAIDKNNKQKTSGPKQNVEPIPLKHFREVMNDNAFYTLPKNVLDLDCAKCLTQALTSTSDGLPMRPRFEAIQDRPGKRTISSSLKFQSNDSDDDDDDEEGLVPAGEPQQLASVASPACSSPSVPLSTTSVSDKICWRVTQKRPSRRKRPTSGWDGVGANTISISQYEIVADFPHKCELVVKPMPSTDHALLTLFEDEKVAILAQVGQIKINNVFILIMLLMTLTGDITGYMFIFKPLYVTTS